MFYPITKELVLLISANQFMTSFFCSQVLKGIGNSDHCKIVIFKLELKFCKSDWQEIVLASNGVTIEINDVSLNLVMSYH